MLLRLFFSILALVSIYTLFSASALVMRLRSLANQRRTGETISLQRPLAALRTRAENMRQLLGATFYLFGFIFFLTLPWATVTLDNSSTLLLTLILRNFLIDFAFAANIFSVFLVLHSVQWFVSSRINAAQHSIQGAQIPTC